LYTRCPHCLTVFIVGAEQLKAAHGNVRCGTCLESFDAIPHLSDGAPQPAATAPRDEHAAPEQPRDEHAASEPPRDEHSALEQPRDEHAASEPPRDEHSALEQPRDEHVAPEQPRDERAALEQPGDARSAAEQLSSTLDAARAAADRDNDTPPVVAPATESGSDAMEPASGHRDPARGPEPSQTDESATQEDQQDSHDGDAGRRTTVLDAPAEAVDESLPAVLREDVAERAASARARRRNLGYGIAALALLVLLALQYFFFMPEDAAQRYPQFRGAIESLCEKFGCVLPERRDPSRIRVISRDVRVHPRYEGVLQIKATLTNAAKFRQPYPRVRFTLFNVNGQTIATRVFRPAEYLGRSVAASARLRPQTPFQVELDVLAPEEAAVSFEFQFL
jgi:predicted Zn finger-like uncharacterized protein